MKIATTDRLDIHQHEIQRSAKVGGFSRLVFQGWLHSEDVPHPVVIVTINPHIFNYVEWIHTDEHFRRTGLATEALRAIEHEIGECSLEGVTAEGRAFTQAYEQ